MNYVKNFLLFLGLLLAVVAAAYGLFQLSKVVGFWVIIAAIVTVWCAIMAYIKTELER